MSEKDDIFAKFRTPEEPRNTAGSEPEPEPSDDDEPYILPPLRPDNYTAFRLGKRRERLLIARAAEPMRFPAYHELRDISFDQAHQQGFYLFFQAMTVSVLGKNLWPVVHAISNSRCASIYEYNAKLFPALPAKDEPLIERIKLLPPESLAED
jgi:hypothetical protein